MPDIHGYRAARARLVEAIAVAIALEGCCHDVVQPIGEECLELQDADDACPSEDEAAAALEVELVLAPGEKWPAREYVDGNTTYTIPAECCYEAAETARECWGSNCHGFGRPLLVGPVAAKPDVRVRATQWAISARTCPRTDELSPTARRYLGNVWLERALAEHAAVASFAVFISELLTLGAPPSLLRAARLAGAQESAHAELCFAIASAYAGESWEAAPWDPPRPETPVSPVTFTERLVIEGCFSETIGVAELAARAAHATDRGVQRALRRLTADETGHAALAWRTLAWIIRVHPETRDAAVSALRRAAETLVVTEGVGARSPALEKHGELSRPARARIHRSAFDEIVIPSARRAGLFAGTMKRDEALL
ncbi:MAG: hypothetical protein HOW73_12230 [Polyangiaceae bacterium]|nr:hypothetical protein [Polyangiaceae bacterium]